MTLASLVQAACASERLLVGLMSGMSRDGIDVALIRVKGRGEAARAVDLVGSATEPYDAALRARLARAVGGDLGEVATLGLDLPRVWARAVGRLLARAGVAPAEVLAIGSHGQTVYHQPRAGAAGAVTLQIGHGEALAALTGLPVVSDFRMKDVALGGEGAPLIPLADLLLFGRSDQPVACWNLGSIANVSVLPAVVAPSARRGIVAFDTGPANALIDAFAADVDPSGIDRDGRLSAAGRVDDDLLLAIYQRRAAWLRQAPPKSAGFATFGPPLAAELRAALPEVTPVDRVRTAVEATARMMRDAFEWHIRPGHDALRLVHLSGGGCRNPTLRAAIAHAFGDLGLVIEPLAEAWSDAKEAIGFALLADEALQDRAGNVPAATGAVRDARLGVLSLP